jgi:hypothetical protein
VISDETIKCLEIAGLLHDVGHGVYSHFYTHLAKELNILELSTHEQIGVVIARKILPQFIPPREIDKVLYFLDPIANYNKDNKDLANIKGLEIIANKKHGLDCDRLDYLARDSYILLPLNAYNTKLLTIIPFLLQNSQYKHQVWEYAFSDKDQIADLQNFRNTLFKFFYKCHPVLEKEEEIIAKIKAANAENMDKFMKKIYPFTEYSVENIDVFVSITEKDFDDLLMDLV